MSRERLLDNFSDDELTAEMFRRTEIRERNRKAELLDAQEVLLANIDVILQMAPRHERTSCSDQSPVNYCHIPSDTNYRCLRCQLLKIKELKGLGWSVDHIRLTYDAVGPLFENLDE